ncbi:hypothetical protein MSHRCOH1_06705 [Candidatus Ornithobacterium hominis]|nr:hypothetical protein [Candidatus Ornithobacterium hominis]CAI9429884.1 hypothetical protein MSHRCOH1_06705 [Candidatus Ornithobacterium hominis]
MEKLLDYHPASLAFLAALFTWFVAALGAAMVFFFRKINQKF